MATMATATRERGLDEGELQHLRESMHGEILTPADFGYDAARTPWNLAVEQQPAVVAMVTGEDDVIAVVNFARKQGFGIAVQGTGHGISAACDGGVLVNTSRMKGVVVNPVRRTARVKAGGIWSEVIREAQRFGLAPLSGSSPDVGVVGYTLGGGAGWLARRYGYAADSLRAVDIVTAEGWLELASDTSNSDLFWALRGGGGNFGIVTALEFNLYPVLRVYGGGIFYPMEQAREILTLYREWVRTVPDMLTSRVAMIQVPPFPSFPPQIRGRWVIAVQACLLGTEAEGEELLRPLRQVPGRLLDTFRLMPYTETGSIANDPKDRRALWIGTEMLSDISPELIAQLTATVGAGDSLLRVVEIRQMGGAISKLAEDASAVGHRQAAFWMNAIAASPNLNDAAAAAEEIARARDAARPYATGGVLLNGLERSSAHRVPSAYSSENYGRLMAVKRKYDPGNLFRFNLNIPPFGTAGQGPA